MVDTTRERLNLFRTHRIPAPQLCIGTGLIGLGVAGHHLAGTALSSIRRSRRLSYQKTHCGHACTAWNKAPRLGRSCQVALMCVSQAWNTKPAYSRSVCDQNALVGGSSASFQDLALVAAGTRRPHCETLRGSRLVQRLSRGVLLSKS